MSTQSKKESGLRMAVANKLRHLREDVRRLSPEDVEARARGEVTASYIRRIEKGEYAPTAETLNTILVALDSNLGLFFEDLIDNSKEVVAQDRRYQRLLQRALEHDEMRQDVIAALRLLEKALSWNSAPVSAKSKSLSI